jgi:hypothetical protein
MTPEDDREPHLVAIPSPQRERPVALVFKPGMGQALEIVTRLALVRRRLRGVLLGYFAFTIISEKALIHRPTSVLPWYQLR